MNKKTLLFTAVLIIIGVGAFILLRPKHVVAPKPAAPKQVTVSGEIICLPHKDTSGPQTMECAFGLQDKNGNNYAFIGNPNVIDWAQTGKKATIKGKLLPPGESIYDIVGTIAISK